jgi:hypothetical protein
MRLRKDCLLVAGLLLACDHSPVSVPYEQPLIPTPLRSIDERGVVYVLSVAGPGNGLSTSSPFLIHDLTCGTLRMVDHILYDSLFFYGHAADVIDGQFRRAMVEREVFTRNGVDSVSLTNWGGTGTFTIRGNVVTAHYNGTYNFPFDVAPDELFFPMPWGFACSLQDINVTPHGYATWHWRLIGSPP